MKILREGGCVCPHNVWVRLRAMCEATNGDRRGGPCGGRKCENGESRGSHWKERSYSKKGTEEVGQKRVWLRELSVLRVISKIGC